MDPRTEQLIRADIKARWAPVFILLWLFLGTRLSALPFWAAWVFSLTS